MCLADPGHRAGRRRVGGQRVGGHPQLLDVRPDGLVLGAEPPGQRGVGGGQPDGGGSGPQRAQRVEDHGHVDGLLQQRAPHRGQQPGRGHAHGGQRHAHPGQHALQRDPPGAAGQRRHLAEAAELIDGQHGVGRFRRGGGAPGAHGDPDVGQGQRGGVVDPVAGHDDRCPALFAAHHVQLAGRGQLGEHLVDPGERADGAGGLGPVAGRQDDPRDAAAAQRPDRLPGVRPDPVLEQQRARGPAVDRDEHGERAVQPGPPADGPDPRRIPGHAGPVGAPEPDLAARDRPGDALAGLLRRRLRAGPAGSRARPPRGRRRRPGRARTPGPATPPGSGSPPAAACPRARRRSRPAGRPVSVPVLSSISVVHRARRSSTPPLLTTTPRRAAADSPETRATGAARISGHGVATTRTATARAGAAQRPRGRGHGQGQRQEPHGVPVGEPDERRLRAFRLADQADDARVGAVGGAGRWPAGRTARPRSPSRCARMSPGRARPAGPRRSARTHPGRRPPRPRVPSTGTTSPGATSSTSPAAISSSGTVSSDPPR